MIIDLLDVTVKKYPDKIAFGDNKSCYTFSQFQNIAKNIGSCIIDRHLLREGIAILMDKSPQTIATMFGVILGGCYYTVLDSKMPKSRMEIIIGVLRPKLIITEKKYMHIAKELIDENLVMLYDDAVSFPMNEEQLDLVAKQITRDDKLYVLFTSGSTGVPKGVVITHGANLSYMNFVHDTFDINENTVFANQTPLYFVMSGLDIYMTIMCGATCYLIPKSLFSFPIDLLEWLNARKVNTLYLVPSSLNILANLNALSEFHLESLKLVMFGGEAMHSKQLNMWMKEYPEVTFVNQYGPTEMTDIIAYHVVKGFLEEEESIPIGKCASHMKIMILDEDENQVLPGKVGELCGTGPSLAQGYFGDTEKTNAVFKTNPYYEEGQSESFRMMYKTGDLVYENEQGNLIFVGRKDFQIKHMGNRIELGEIEAAVSAVGEIQNCCCLFDNGRDLIVLFYVGDIDENQLLNVLRNRLPQYMIPNVVNKLVSMPLNLNGKIDRVLLKQQI